MSKNVTSKIIIKNQNKLDLIRRLEIGHIDGLVETDLDNYFLDNHYWEKIIDGEYFFIIGRKGTGKSAIYRWLFNRQYIKGATISNLSFNEFPFNKLLNLEDDDFSRPNQYQSIWKNIILTEFARLIINDPTSQVDDDYKQLKLYVESVLGKELNDLHKIVVEQTNKREGGLFLSNTGLKIGSEIKSKFSGITDNIHILNRKLEQILIRYFLYNCKEKRYFIQFDQLDENYSMFSNNLRYLQSITSLFKVIYYLNYKFRKNGNYSKVIAYLRTDIYYRLSSLDSETSRWERNLYFLDWSIKNKKEWDENPPLLALINKRLQYNLGNFIVKDPFEYIFSDICKIRDRTGHRKRMYSLFRYVMHRTFFRPRDLIQFSICIIMESKSEIYRLVTPEIVYNAEKVYSKWLMRELNNEINPEFEQGTELLQELLRKLGSKSFSLSYFERIYKRINDNRIKHKAIELLNELYNYGIIQNISRKEGSPPIYFSSYRNPGTKFDSSLEISVHSGLQRGLDYHESKV